MTHLSITLTSPVGPPDAPLLVLGPSLGTSTILWEPTIPLLTDQYRVVAWDLPGHGASTSASEPFTSALLADAVAHAVRPLATDRVLYAGVSLGGAVGLEMLARHPEMISAAVIIASGAYLGDAQPWHERAALVRAESTSVIVAQGASRWFTEESLERMPDLVGRLLQTLRDADDESYARCCEALTRYDMRDRLHEIAVPTLAVWGEFDPVVAEDSATQIAQGVQHGEVARIDGAAHLVPAEQPEAIAAAMRSFFTKVA